MTIEPSTEEYLERINLQNDTRKWREDSTALEREEYRAGPADLADIQMRRKKLCVEGEAIEARRKAYEERYRIPLI